MTTTKRTRTKRQKPDSQAHAKPQSQGPSKAHSGRQSASAALEPYRQKRDFTRTAEPAGGSAASPASATTLQFVVQKHAARNLHFDLRLQLDGVMKSWAVPKGPSLDPAVKRLAMQVEDHPIEYNTFEGTIPAGEYGGGTVMVWDRGTYGPDESFTSHPADGATPEDALRTGYARGDLKFVLHGTRLRGSWVLVRTHFSRGSARERPQWLFMKHRDAAAKPGSDIVAETLTSAVTGRTMEEIAAAGDTTSTDGAGDRVSEATSRAPKSGARKARTPRTKAPATRAAGKRAAGKRAAGKRAAGAASTGARAASSKAARSAAGRSSARRRS